VIVGFVDDNRAEFGVEPICRALQVAPSTYYAAKRRETNPSARAVRDAAMMQVLMALWLANRRVYGAHKLWKAAQRAGHDIGRDATARLMRLMAIEGVSRRRRKVFTTRPDPGALRAPDLVNRNFTATEPNQLWVTDLTYVPTRAGMAYVCFIVDAFSRRIVGWRVASNMKTDMVLDALEMARRSRGGRRLIGLVTHSDAGSQGEIRWSSQHLQPGGGWTPCTSTSAKRRSERCGARSGRRAGRRRRGGSTGLRSGRRSVEACRATTRPPKIGMSSAFGARSFREAGGMPPLKLVPVSGRYLSFEEREEIAILHAKKHGVREIARRIGRSPSTISRELRRNSSTRTAELEYRASTAQWHAERRASRPKVPKLVANPRLHDYVQDRLVGKIKRPDGTPVPGPDVKFIGRRHGRRADRRWGKAWSPEQISNRLRIDFPDDESMRISHEAIYQALYIQGRGALKRELVQCLRTGRALRVPRARTRGRGKKFVTPELLISERPAEIEDRAVPGHWEGDLILGLESSAIGTLVERTTRFTMLLHLPRMDGHGEGPRDKNGPALAGHGAEAVRDEIARVIETLPQQLRRSLTWDQGSEMAEHAQLRIDTGLEIYFCDPHSPWQRGSNENTNGLLRQYFPKGTDLSRHHREDLDAVALALNTRPRKTLGWRTPAEALNELLLSA